MSGSNDGGAVKHLPIYFHGSISLREIEEALHSRGMHLRGDGRGRLHADRVPRFVVRDADAIARRNVATPAMRVVGGPRTRVDVRFDSGAHLEITEVGEGELRVGDRVRVLNNHVYRE